MDVIVGIVRATARPSLAVVLTLLQAFDTPLASGLMPGMPKVRKYSTFVNGLCHLPPRMKNLHGSMRKKPFR